MIKEKLFAVISNTNGQLFTASEAEMIGDKKVIIN